MNGLRLEYLTQIRKPGAKCILLRVRRRVSITITIITTTIIFRAAWKAASQPREEMRPTALAKRTG